MTSKIVESFTAISSLCPKYRCICNDGWFGATCASKHNPCDRTVTRCHGRCVITPDDSHCDCPYGKTGTHCDQGMT